jgi:hypothetical protein
MILLRRRNKKSRFSDPTSTEEVDPTATFRLLEKEYSPVTTNFLSNHVFHNNRGFEIHLSSPTSYSLEPISSSLRP